MDVFFVISGFLITTQLVSNADRTARGSLYTNSMLDAKRILPAAAIVLRNCDPGPGLFVPRISGRRSGCGAIIGSALYVGELAACRAICRLSGGRLSTFNGSNISGRWRSKNVLSRLAAALILVGVVVARLMHTTTRRTLWVGLAVVAFPSFAWALIETGFTSHPPALSSSPQHVWWELPTHAAVALGAGVFCQNCAWMWRS